MISSFSSSTALSCIFSLALTLVTFVAAPSNTFAQDSFDFNSNNDEFLPVEQAYQLNLEFQETENGLKPLLVWSASESYYLYKHGFKHYFKTLGNENNQASAQENEASAQIPTGTKTQDPYFGEVETYRHQVIIPINEEQLPESGNFVLRTQSQGCADAGLCYPPYDIYSEIDLSTQSVKTITADEYHARSPADIDAAPETKGGLSQLSKGRSIESGLFQNTQKMTVFAAVISAFLGGLILNLMPCLLPVLSIKVLQIQQSAEHPKAHGLAYMGGVIFSFWVIAAVLIAFRAGGQAVGWGFQLQQPWFITVLIGLFFVLGLSLSGYFELGSRLMGVASDLGTSSQQSPKKATSAFNTGLLAVLVATPCTAPFMGTALGFALSQPNSIAMLVFTALGFGMALPLTLITFIPSLHKYMPKPGQWMVTFKELLAFPLYLTVIWLLWVLGNQTSTTTVAMVLACLVGICFALWAFKKGGNLLKVLGTLTLLSMLPIFNSSYMAPVDKQASSVHVSYSEDNLLKLRSQNKAVFIDLTADWCITCLTNKATTLGKPSIQNAFAEAGITYMVGDWTNFDPEITALLEKYKRSGIPFYILYPEDQNAKPLILPQLLNETIVLNAIGEASKYSRN